MVMDNENYKLITNQSDLWKQASKDLRNFCEKNQCLGYEYSNSIIGYYHNDGMPDYDFLSLSITDEAFFQKYINYFMAELTPKNVLPGGACYDYACVYPELNQILGEHTHIFHDDLTEPWCVHLEKPYLLSKEIFELLSKYIVAHLNKVSIFEITVGKIEWIPCLVASENKIRIRNAELFFEWVNSHNEIMRQEPEYIPYYGNLWGEDIENFELCAEWKGDDSELKKIPLFVDVCRREWENEGCFGDKYVGAVKYQMKVSIDDESVIHIRPDSREICKHYYEKVMTAIKETNFWKRTGDVLYEGVWDDSEMEHCVQFLIDNNYEQDNKRFISIKYWKDFSEILSPEERYRMQCHILVGRELL